MVYSVTHVDGASLGYYFVPKILFQSQNMFIYIYNNRGFFRKKSKNKLTKQLWQANVKILNFFRGSVIEEVSVGKARG